jgi:hypothetical protein
MAAVSFSRAMAPLYRNTQSDNPKNRHLDPDRTNNLNDIQSYLTATLQNVISLVFTSISRQ